MEELEPLVSKFKSLPDVEKRFSAVVDVIAKANLQLFIELFGIKSADDIYQRLKYNSHQIDAKTYQRTKPIYELHRNVWERKYYLVHHLNIVRVFQGRRGVVPVADNSFTIKCFEDVVVNTMKVVHENEHLGLDDNHRTLLTVAVVNYFLRQIEYPSIIGKYVADRGLNAESVWKDVNEALGMWFGGTP